MATVALPIAEHGDLARQLLAIAEQVEAGQADSPLAEQARALLAPGDPTLSLVILGLQPQARAAALRWLVGPQHNSVSVRLCAPLDALEVRLQERGYSIETDALGRVEFDAPEPFAAALDEAWRPEPGDAEPVRLAMAAPAPLRNLRILVLRDCVTVLRRHGLLNVLAGGTPVLLVADSGEPDPEPEHGEAMRALCAVASGVWPVFIGDRPARQRAWMDDALCGECIRFPAAMLGEGGAFVPDFIVRGAAHPVRARLRQLGAAERAVRLVEMIHERIETDTRQLQSRQKRESRLDELAAAPVPPDQDVKAAIDRCKAQLADDLARLTQAMRERSRRALARGGDIGAALGPLLASLKAEDLDREPGTKSIRLSLRPVVTSELRQRLARVLRHHLDEECAVIRDSLEEFRKSGEKVLADLGAVDRGLDLRAPQQGAVWQHLSDLLELQVKYRGEIARRGFLQRLGEGRRVVFVGLMVFSLVGGFLGFNIRRAAGAGIAFLVAFVIVVAYTYRSWRREDDELLEKEMERVRESVEAELTRVLGDILREKQGRLQQSLDLVKAQAHARLDEVLRECQHARAEATLAERRGARSRLKFIEQRLRQLAATAQQLARARSAAQQAAVRARDDLRGSLAGDGGSRADA